MVPSASGSGSPQRIAVAVRLLDPEDAGYVFLQVVAYRGGWFGGFKSPQNSEDTGGVLDRMSKKNRHLDFLLQFTVFSYGCIRLSQLPYHIISFISMDPYRIANPYGYGKWSHQYKVYKTITIYGI